MRIIEKRNKSVIPVFIFKLFMDFRIPKWIKYPEHRDFSWRFNRNLREWFFFRESRIIHGNPGISLRSIRDDCNGYAAQRQSTPGSFGATPASGGHFIPRWRGKMPQGIAGVDSRNASPSALHIGLILLLSLFLTACIQDPAIAPRKQAENADHAVFVLNEGLFGRDNASVSRYVPGTGEITDNFFQTQNPGLRLGDTSNDFFIHDSLIYIVMNGSNSIEIASVPAFIWQRRVLLKGNPSPRSIFVAADTLAFVTALYTDEVLVINPKTGQTIDAIPVGPAPEGMASFGDYLFVANSGLGDIRSKEEGANTLSVIEKSTATERFRLPGFYNNQNIKIGPDDLLYVSASGSHLSDSLFSGIAIYDPVQLALIDTLRIPHHPRDFVFSEDGFGYVLTDSAVVAFSLSTRRISDAAFFPLPEEIPAYLYAIAIDTATGDLYISNARNFTTNGELFCVDASGAVRFTLPVKINPGAILIY